MKEIPLTQGKVAIVDDEDFERVSEHKWYAMLVDGHWYAESRPIGYLHRFLLNSPADCMVDHIDGDGLNCQRYNMRLATNRQNQHNARTRIDNTTGFRGVCVNKDKWTAQIKIDGVLTYLGRFASPEEAARAYDAKARETRGEFARTNFPN
jgi:hypothetical protein